MRQYTCNYIIDGFVKLQNKIIFFIVGVSIIALCCKHFGKTFLQSENIFYKKLLCRTKFVFISKFIIFIFHKVYVYIQCRYAYISYFTDFNKQILNRSRIVHFLKPQGDSIYLRHLCKMSKKFYFRLGLSQLDITFCPV